MRLAEGITDVTVIRRRSRFANRATPRASSEDSSPAGAAGRRSRWRVARYGAPVLVAFALATTLAACGGSSSGSGSGSTSSNSTAKTKPGGTVTIAFDAEADNDFQAIEPQAYCQAVCVSWFQAIFDPLIVPNPSNYAAQDHFSGVLAQSWSANANDTAYTFHLKPQAKFTNGQEVTSADVQYSFDRACQKSRLSVSGFACSLIPEYKDTKIINNTTFTIEMKAPDPNFLPDIAQGAYFGIVPKALLQSEGETKFGNDPVGSGPYKFVSWNKSQGIITLARNPAYTWGPAFSVMHGHPPAASKLVVEYIADAQTRESAFQSGQIQAFQNLPYSDVARFQADKSAQVLLPPYGGGTGWLYLNTKSGPTADLAVRQAIAQAVDRQAMNKSVFFNVGQVTRTFMERIPESDTSALAPASDLAAAKQTLDAAGWKVGAGGIREKDGQQLTFAGVGTAADQAALTLIQADLQKAGMKLTIKTESDSQTFTDMNNHTFGIWLGGDVWGFADPSPTLLYSVFDGSQLPPDGFNPSWFNNSDFNTAIATAVSSPDASARSSAYTQAQQILAQQVPVDPVISLPVITVLAKNVAGITPDVTGGYLYFYDTRYTQ
jgi:peptide/nickel transport system substrate-binding protein